MPTIWRPCRRSPVRRSAGRVRVGNDEYAPFHRAIEHLGAITARPPLGGLYTTDGAGDISPTPDAAELAHPPLPSLAGPSARRDRRLPGGIARNLGEVAPLGRSAPLSNPRGDFLAAQTRGGFPLKPEVADPMDRRLAQVRLDERRRPRRPALSIAFQRRKVLPPSGLSFLKRGGLDVQCSAASWQMTSS